MTKAIRIHATGGPEVLKWEDIEVGHPGPGQVRLQQSACGLNYIDVYGRSGMYPVGELPAVLGMEGVGLVDAVGEGVDDLAAGDRVAYPMDLGAYAEARLIDASKLVSLPDSISDETAAAMMLKGLTAHYLLFRTYPVKAGDSILVYAAAGGVGLILCQWANLLGANVIGCVGSQEKALLVVIRQDGSLEDIRVLSSSGYAVLDEAAIKIVRMAAPYAPFPPELKATTDKLEIIRTWQFQENQLSSD